MLVLVHRVGILLLAWTLVAACDSAPNNYAAGFQEFDGTDSSRVYKPNTEITDALHFRPIHVEVWYPASPMNQPGAPLHFKDLLTEVESRYARFNDQDDGVGYTNQVLDYLCRALDCPSPDQLGRTPTSTFRGAPRADGRFPLVLYLAGINGAGFENYQLLERLAQAGFVVASIRSVGRYPGTMTTQIEDAMAQAKDAAYAIRLLQNSMVLQDKIALLAYSWGGVAAIQLASERPDIQTVISLDGSEASEGGDVMGNANKEKIAAHYIYVGTRGQNPPADDVFFMVGARHEDFTSLPMLERSSAEKSSYPVLANWVVDVLTAQLVDDHPSVPRPQSSRLKHLE